MGMAGLTGVLRARYKIPLIVGIAVPAGLAAIIMGPVLFMIAFGAIASIMPDPSEEAVEKDFAQIPEVGVFTERYPDYGTSHYGDFMGWRVVQYTSETSDAQSISMAVRKNVLHQGIEISAGCGPEFSYALDVPHDQVIDFLQSGRCFVDGR